MTSSTSLRSRRPVWDSVRSPHRLSLGLRRLGSGESWLDLDEDLAVDLAEKDRLFRKHRPDVLVELPGSRNAQLKVLELVVDTVLSDHPDCYARDGHTLRVMATGEELDLVDPTRPPIELAARCIQEDLVVMDAGPNGWRLVAAAVCFPTRWALRPQLGRSMTDIHDPVPGYAEKLDVTSNQFFDGMKPGDVFARDNWSLLDDPALHQPTRKLRSGRNVEIDDTNAGDEIWLRVEHQTLQTLPRSNAILFGIRVYRTKLCQVAEDPSASRTLIEAIETMDPAMQRYKSIERVRDSAIAYLTAAIAKCE
jgi:hypothetical protein